MTETRDRTVDRYDAEDLALQVDGELRDDYSGRGMFGETCFGIVHDSSEVELGLALGALLDPDTAERLARAARTDSMGRSIITYFDGWTVEDGDEDDPGLEGK